MNKQITKKITDLLLKGKYQQLLILLFFTVLVSLVQILLENSSGRDLQANLIEVGTVRVERVIDGDTFTYILNGETRTVRLLGVDTPETVDPRKPVQCMGEEVSKISKNLLDGQVVRLEADPLANSVDRYNREIRYVYLSEGRMVNRYLVANGLAYTTPEYQFSLKDEFVNLEKEAKMEGKGLWNESTCN